VRAKLFAARRFEFGLITIDFASRGFDSLQNGMGAKGQKGVVKSS
jgi:hypothetical protein